MTSGAPLSWHALAAKLLGGLDLQMRHARFPAHSSYFLPFLALIDCAAPRPCVLRRFPCFPGAWVMPAAPSMFNWLMRVRISRPVEPLTGPPKLNYTLAGIFFVSHVAPPTHYWCRAPAATFLGHRGDLCCAFQGRGYLARTSTLSFFFRWKLTCVFHAPQLHVFPFERAPIVVSPASPL
ncbi:hypothetical protein C8R47DRAFT_303187 [Mycena vitilis]|nr:hypothetical protein C8R47DRAFT_303187 [Mycena vitilis]